MPCVGACKYSHNDPQLYPHSHDTSEAPQISMGQLEVERKVYQDILILLAAMTMHGL